MLWLWHNAEGSAPAWFYRKALDASGPMFWWPDWWWYAIRNPVNNMRFIFEDREANSITNWDVVAFAQDRPKISMEAEKMIEAGQKVAYRWMWSGLFAGYRRVWLNAGNETYNEIWIGWKLGSDVPGLGFTLQLRFRRKIGS